ncbi:hypothetical protein SERLADRAFT_435865 [Serpula lacrymans var. lacrymans S7.9]|uniref:Uncharacterized protein n=1 Tax=Serpula lacrymans var. lacrymans (strain S7.9) TaxID=578457 RepID=F8NNZ5_SERL9|nr:uncharacterized protein SERLADRAFT_435865 [Serpula lacrymans var. lacrymans S7.9]EGO28094.1 hypothetical protein SERLADRAFT_435865 [Serpula lacrymans var. lacrymans S7.9]
MSPVDNVDNKELLGVPKLEPDGSNWSIYKTRLAWALADKALQSPPKHKHLASTICDGIIPEAE